MSEIAVLHGSMFHAFQSVLRVSHSYTGIHHVIPDAGSVLFLGPSFSWTFWCITGFCLHTEGLENGFWGEFCCFSGHAWCLFSVTFMCFFCCVLVMFLLFLLFGFGFVMLPPTCELDVFLSPVLFVF